MENVKPREGLPSNARLVFKGVIFETWQWEQEMFDGSKAIFEKIWRYPTVEVIVTVGDKIMLLEEDQPDRKNNLNFPGGRADHSEDLLSEAKRELLEETGYESDDWTLFFEHGRDGKVIQHFSYFIARNAIKVREAEVDPGERIKISFISFDELIALAEEPKFWTSPDFRIELIKMKFNPEKREAFKKQLFP